MRHSELGTVPQQLHLFARFEGRESYVRAVGTSEGVAEAARVAGPRLSLDGKVQLVEVVLLQLEDAQLLVGPCPPLLLLLL